MTTSAIMSALRVAGRQQITASTLVGEPVATGSHVFRMPRFTRVREKVGNGAAVSSSPFSVGGHDWRINCYPNGDHQETKGYISLYLRHASHAQTGDAMAKFKLSLLDKASKPFRTARVIKEAHRFTGGCWGWEKFIKLQDLDDDDKHGLLQDDCLSVLCDVTVDLELHSEEYCADEDLARAPPPFGLRGLAEAIWNRQEADVRIVVGGGHTTFAAHRWVLEARSPVLKADLAQLASSSSNELRVDDMDADVCKALLQFIYTDSPPPQLAAMAKRLLVAADRYGVEQLKLSCEEALCDDINGSSVATTLVLAERHGCPVLREACMEFLSCPGNLNAMLASRDGLEELKKGCPSALVELLMKKQTPPPQEQSNY